VASESILAASDLSVAKRSRFWDSRLWVDYFALTKPEVNFLIVVTTFAGFYLGCLSAGPYFPWLRCINALLGTLLVASGAGTLNQYIERRFDVQMRRTSRRPLAAGRINPSAVLWSGLALSVLGTIYLAGAVKLLASLLALGTLLSYLFFYTPLKRKSPLCTLVGAFSGAMPPLIGWAAASGRLSIEAGILFSVLFLWQFPHFMSIAWMYREDYARAGYLVLPQDEHTRTSLAIWQTLVPLLLLAPVSLLSALTKKVSTSYCIGSLLLWSMFLYYGVRFARRKSNSSARQLLTASILYLPSVFLLMILSRLIAGGR
jgi:protoheme IX farnesyltransferase